jgi:nucleoside-diphosphate-sugar epimerase
MESLFVTGGAGYIGRRLLGSLDPGAYSKIICLTRSGAHTAPPHVEFVRADLVDSDAYAAALRGCGIVLHLAAVTGKSRPEDYFRVNREGTRSLIEACRRAGIKRFIYISTIATKFRDQRRYYYAQSKLHAEEVVRLSGLSYTIVRPTMVIGKGAPVLESLSRLAAMPVLPVFGSGRAHVQPISVDDLVACLAKILEGDVFESRTVEIGGPEVLCMEELLIKIRRALGKTDAPIVHLPAGVIAESVGLMEKLFLPVLPFTAGQIASFVNDGTASPDPQVREWQRSMQTVDAMLACLKGA